MEPQLPTPQSSPENGPAHFTGGETFSGVNASESAPKSPEKQEIREQYVGGPSNDPVVLQPATPVLPPLPTIAPPTTASPAPVDTSNPTTAGDDDLIEKEWVEKAKKVIADTKHDPYLQEQEVSKLQADYLQKRYGKTVSLPTDGA